MQFDYSPKVQQLRERVDSFMQQHVYPNEQRFHDEIEENTKRGARWTPTTLIEELKPKARAAGLWNLFLPQSSEGAGLTNLEYAPLAELMGRVPWAPEVFNCSAPDTGNMETLERYGSEAHKQQWLKPLLAGEIRSAFVMTEPAVASSDATNIQTSIKRDGDDYVINGRKWWISGRGRSSLPHLHRDGQDRPRGAAALAAVDDSGAVGHARHQCDAAAKRVRL